MMMLAVALPVAADGESAIPAWLTISGSYRLRYEYLDNTFRIADPGTDELVASRLFLHLRASGEKFYGGVELQDSRAWLDSSLTPLGTDDVNVLEPVQAYVGYRSGDIDVQLGRMTMDVGDRRLISRNRFRNTTNVFTGVQLTWARPERFTLRTFLTMPVNRLPGTLERERLRNNEFELDQERRDQVFWGINLAGLGLRNGLGTEWFLYGIKEHDRPSLPTRNRDFVTAGLRLHKSSDLWAFELVSVLQAGETRSTASPTDVTDIDHRAGLMHFELERRLNGAWQPSLIFRYDYASGDDDPDDDEFNRFDSLFGDRRWEFGPTGIYGALTRSNIQSPGLALRLQPTPAVDARLDYRAAWLASDRDLMPTSGLRDRDGNSGSFVGHQVDARLRWVPDDSNVSLEFGAACLFKGEFVKEAPGAPPGANTLYAYLATSLAF